MEIAEFQTLSPVTLDAILEQLWFEKPKLSLEVETYENERLVYAEYEPEFHRIFDRVFYPDKQIPVKGQRATKTQPAVQGGFKYQKVARRTLPLQKLIVSRAAAFTAGGGVEIESDADGEDETNFVELVQKTMDDNKMDFKNLDICKRYMSEPDCAEIWYPETAEKGYWKGTVLETANEAIRLRCKVVSPNLFDFLYPAFNLNGRMIGFCRRYHGWINGIKTMIVDCYSDTSIWRFTGEPSKWVVEQKENVFGKIPVIYYRQYRPEWHDVQNLITRFEVLLSKYADTNDYFGSPAAVIEGQIVEMPDKDEIGKVFRVGTGGSIKYLTWDQAPAAIKLELDEIKERIFTDSRTAQMSLNQLTGFAQAPSGTALGLMFFDAIQKAREHQMGAYGEGKQRSINFVQHGIATLNVKAAGLLGIDMWPGFPDALPTNMTELITNIGASIQDGTMSQETGVNKNPLIVDKKGEMDKLKDEDAANKPDPLAQEYAIPGADPKALKVPTGTSAPVAPKTTPDTAGKLTAVA